MAVDMTLPLNQHAQVAPVVKWAGGKRQLVPALTALLPADIQAWCEPFAGGAALFFAQQPRRAWLNDVNQDLMCVYRVIQHDVETLITALQRHQNTPDYFYLVRDMDRDQQRYAALPDIEKAARLIYLNKTCYNGLFRVNSAGEFNTPFGYYKNPNIVNAATLRAVSAYFNRSDISFSSFDYVQVLQTIDKDFFVYLDPPYDPLSDTASFTGYAKGGFTRADQTRLREQCDALTQRGVRFMLSNSDTAFIREQYACYRIESVQARRAINANPRRRGDVGEVVVMNYE